MGDGGFEPERALPTGDEQGTGTKEKKCCCSFSVLCNSLIMCFYLYVQGAWLLAGKLSVETRELQKHSGK